MFVYGSNNYLMSNYLILSKVLYFLPCFKTHKLPWSCQERPEALTSCLKFIPIVLPSISQGYPHLEIRPNTKGGTTWAMWSHLCRTRFLLLFETFLIMWGKARGSEILPFGVDSDCLVRNYPHLEIWRNGNGLDHIALVLHHFQNDNSTTLPNLTDHLSKGQKLTIVDSDCLPLDLHEISTRRNLAR